MREQWARRVLYFAGTWNVVGGLTALAGPARHFDQMYAGSLDLHDPLQAFFFQATWINVIAWGVGYLLAARWSSVRAGILVAGAAGKLAYFAACWSLFRTGLGNGMLLGTGLMDVGFASMFLLIVAGRPSWIYRA